MDRRSFFKASLGGAAAAVASASASASLSGLGAATADMVYGAVAAFGLTAVSAFLLAQQGWLRLLGGAALIWLGLSIALKPPPGASAGGADSPRLWPAFAQTFALTLANPATILSFLAVFAGLAGALVGMLFGLAPDFQVGPGPKFHVYLVPQAPVTAGTDVARTMFVDLGRLRAFRGSQNYPLPAGVDIRRYGSEHTGAIITGDAAAAEEFLAGIDSAVGLWNASTQFCDGGEFGFQVVGIDHPDNTF